MSTKVDKWGLMYSEDSRTRTGNNFMAGMLCPLPILHMYMQQFSNEPGTATGHGVVEEL